MSKNIVDFAAKHHESIIPIILVSGIAGSIFYRNQAKNSNNCAKSTERFFKIADIIRNIGISIKLLVSFMWAFKMVPIIFSAESKKINFKFIVKALNGGLLGLSSLFMILDKSFKIIPEFGPILKKYESQINAGITVSMITGCALTGIRLCSNLIRRREFFDY